MSMTRDPDDPRTPAAAGGNASDPETRQMPSEGDRAAGASTTGPEPATGRTSPAAEPATRPMRTEADPTTRPSRTAAGPPARPVVAGQPTAAPTAVDSRTIVRRQREQFGGLKIGSCFFGWLAATGMVVVLTAVLAAVGATLGWTQAVNVQQATADPYTVGLVGSILLLVVVFIGYYCGGYVAGRMARFHGARQGVGVWLWAVVIAIVLAILGLIAGTQFDLLGRIGGIPHIPINQGTLTFGGVLTALGVAVVSLVGAILGGLAGMRFHRRVDRVDVAP